MVNLGFLLLVAMLLINAVLLHAVQRILMKDVVADGKLLIAVIEERIQGDATFAAPLPDNRHLDPIQRLMQQSGFSSLLILGPGNATLQAGDPPPAGRRELIRQAQSAIRSGRVLTRLTGSTWGIFWKQKSDLILSAPLSKGDQSISGISLVYPLQNIYHPLRSSLRFILVYAVVNAALLTIIGFFRLSKLTVRPIQKLVESVESYHEDDGALLFGDTEGNEFKQLSKALNQMLNRLSQSRNELKSTVKSLKQANIDLKKAQNDILNAEKMASVGRLSAGIAHEIGNPIAIVIGYLELLKRDDTDDAERRDFIVRTENEINRINTIIRQLLDFSRPATGEETLIHVHELITDVAAVIDIQPLMANLRIECHLDAPRDSVAADAVQLRQVFLNLIMNAADAMGSQNRADPGRLAISTRLITDGGESIISHLPALEIRFVDNGPGIPAQDISKIFDPFFTTKAPGKGTGLGLSVCFMMIEAWRGRIKAFNNPESGATMLIQLPLKTKAADGEDPGE